MTLVHAETGEVIDEGEYLEALAARVREEYVRSKDALGEALDAYFAIGQCLIEARTFLISDKAFGAWFAAEKFGFTTEWARILRLAAEYEGAVRKVVASQLATSGKTNLEKAVKEVAAASKRMSGTQRKPKKPSHPAMFSDPILDAIGKRVAGASVVLDPFAGEGTIHKLSENGVVEKTVGVELEPEWAAKHPDTVEGNALQLTFEAASVDAIATSPTYGNRMADHHNAKDDSTRLTYKHTLGRDLSDDNSGQLQWGPKYKQFHVKAWAEADRVLKPGGTFVVNIKDHFRDGVKEDVAAWHNDTLCRVMGYECIGIDIIPTSGSDAGDNADKRVPGELVFTYRKPTS